MTELSCYYSRWEIRVVAPYATGILKDTIIPIIEAKPKLKTACFFIWTGINQGKSLITLDELDKDQLTYDILRTKESVVAFAI